MDRPFVKYPLLLFALGVILKLIVLLYGLQQEGLDVFNRMLGIPILLLAAVFLGIRYREGEAPSFLDRAKSGMKAGMIFTVCFSLFSGLYYGQLDPHYFEPLNAERIQALKERKQEAEENEKVQDPLPNMTPEEYHEQLKELTGPLRILTFNLLVFTFFTVAASFLIGLIEHFVQRRARSS